MKTDNIMTCQGQCEHGVHIGDKVRFTAQAITRFNKWDIHVVTLDHIHRGVDGVMELRFHVIYADQPQEQGEP
jgi:hypothetical protein